jgi:hypothetical protein
MAGIARKIEISDADKETLLKWKRSPTTPQKLVRRAAIILAAAEGLNNKAILCQSYLHFFPVAGAQAEGVIK